MINDNINNNDGVLLTNIQRFSIHDGPGIRTTIFLKGCRLHCPWCSNPENIRGVIEEYVRDGIVGKYGHYWTNDELFDEVMKDRKYYGYYFRERDMKEVKGGITLSGGEPLLQIIKLEGFLKEIVKNNIHIAVETSLYADKASVIFASHYVDLFYVDVKLLNSKRCRNELKGDTKLYQGNIKTLFSINDKNKIVFRVPIIGGHTDDRENLDQVASLVADFKPRKVEFLKGHNLGDNKYKSLGLESPPYIEPDMQVVEEIIDYLMSKDVEAEIFSV